MERNRLQPCKKNPEGVRNVHEPVAVQILPSSSIRTKRRRRRQQRAAKSLIADAIQKHMQCSWPYLARLAFRRPAHSLTSAALVSSIRVQPTYSTTSIPISRSPVTLWCTKFHTAAEPQIRPPPFQPAIRHSREARWKMCRTIEALMRNHEVADALRTLGKLPISIISPRRYTHLVLHGLLRKGVIPEASLYAQHCLNRGINVRKCSLEAVVIGMIQNVEQNPPLEPLTTTVPLDAATILNPAPATNQNPDIVRSALALYEAERVSGRRPSDRFFRYLMVLCILNGEIILASLLFGTIMREWQTRDMAERASGNAPSTQSAALPENTIYRLNKICLFLNEALVTEFTDPVSQAMHSTSLQALAQLAYSLDHGQLPYGVVNILIKTMLLLPRGPAMVWIPGDSPDDPPQHVNAYMYIHDVIQRLISSLSTRRRHVKEHRHPDFTWLARRDYVKLLEYSLKHRHSLEEARAIIQAIVEEDPDILQAAELRNVVLHAATAFPPGVIHDFMREFGLKVPTLKWDPDATDYTYSTAINTLTKVGQARAVMDAVPGLIPGLFFPEHDQSLSVDQNKELRRDLIEEGLKRGVKLGPVVFVCLLNAARSMGNTNYCERIFQFALAAQEQSWDREPDNVPWCLPVHAYTVMVRVYAKEMGCSIDSVATGWGQWNNDEPVSRPVMGRRMIMVTLQLMNRQARLLEERLKRMKRTRTQRWQNVPYQDSFFFRALIDAFERTPDDPIYVALKSEMEAGGYRPPDRYLNSLEPHYRGVDEQYWRRPKDVRPYAYPPEDSASEKHEPALFTKMVPKKMTNADVVAL